MMARLMRATPSLMAPLCRRPWTACRSRWPRPCSPASSSGRDEYLAPLSRAKRNDIVSEMVMSSALGGPNSWTRGGAILKLTDGDSRCHHILSWRCSETPTTGKKNTTMSTTRVVQIFGMIKVLPPNTAGTCAPTMPGCHQDGFSMASN